MDFVSQPDSQNPALWDDIAKQYSEESDAGETEVAAELESILSGLGVMGGTSILEAGCGSGHISSHLASRGYNTTLVDFSKIALDKAEKLYKKNSLDGRFVYSDLFDMSKDVVGMHDVVWNSGVLEHFDAWQAISALQTMASVAKKFIIVMVPNPTSISYMTFRDKALAQGSWQWGLEILRENLNDIVLFSGLEIVKEQFVGETHLKYFDDYTGLKRDDSQQVSDQRYLKVVVARPSHNIIPPDSKLKLLYKILKEDSKVLRKTYYHDADILMNRLHSFGIKTEQNYKLIAQLNDKLYSARNNAATLQDKIEQLQQALHTEQKEKADLKYKLQYEKNRLDVLLNTKTWKLTKLYEKKFQGNVGGKIIEKIVDYTLRKEDTQKDKENDTQTNNTQKDKEDTIHAEIQSILKRHPDVKGVIIYPPAVDWNIPLLQRPQHMAMHLAQNNWLYFYCTTNAYDHIDGFEKLSENLYLTNMYDELVDTLDSFFMFVHCAHPTITVPELEALSGKAVLIYDYLDEIHPDVSGLREGDVIERHTYMMKNSMAVVATAGKLYSNVAKVRNTGIYLLPNGVDYDHFHIKRDSDNMPKEFQSIVKSGGVILGYFGAVAKWIDYSLIKTIARENPSWHIVLIGWDYDGTVGNSGLDEYENIHYLGVKKYDILPDYAVCFDVCILPFVVSDVTNSTSPIKLFEYMALGKPIVTTPIREVNNYKCPLVASTPGEFAQKVYDALKLRDDSKYLEMVDSEARANTWKKRFDDLDDILLSLNS